MCGGERMIMLGWKLQETRNRAPKSCAIYLHPSSFHARKTAVVPDKRDFDQRREEANLLTTNAPKQKQEMQRRHTHLVEIPPPPAPPPPFWCRPPDIDPIQNAAFLAAPSDSYPRPCRQEHSPQPPHRHKGTTPVTSSHSLPPPTVAGPWDQRSNGSSSSSSIQHPPSTRELREDAITGQHSRPVQSPSPTSLLRLRCLDDCNLFPKVNQLLGPV